MGRIRLVYGLAAIGFALRFALAWLSRGSNDADTWEQFAWVISQLTEDDSWLSALKAQEPHIDASQLERHPLRHVITKAIGTLTDTEISIHERPLVHGDTLLLCTDGLHDLVPEAKMLEVVDTERTLEQRAQTLIELALEAGGRDNVTALLVKYERQ